ncbi:LETM1 and EF-hand domain-containing protein 1-like protein, partial [Dinothrombium tinctorium]
HSHTVFFDSRIPREMQKHHFITRVDLLPHLLSNHFFATFRLLNTNSSVDQRDHSSKVEQTVKVLKETEHAKSKCDEQNKNAINSIAESQSGAVEKPKPSLIIRIRNELIRYYHGFRLLFFDIKVLHRLVWRVFKGETLTDREHRQMVRTVADIFRLVPFLVFIIVPFSGFLFPVFVKLFPNMLPSTFQHDADKETKAKAELKLKIDMAKFLQQTLNEMALKAKRGFHSQTAKEFEIFLEKIRKSDTESTNEDIFKFSKFFKDDFVLNSFSRSQLISLCMLLELKPTGTNDFLRFQLQYLLRLLKADDKIIQEKRIENLSISELQRACRARCLLTLGVSEDQMKSQLQQWLELSLNKDIPTSLLIMSHVLNLSEDLSPEKQLKATILSLPDSAIMAAKYHISETEGRIDYKTKIELIKKEEEAIIKERTELETVAKTLKEKLEATVSILNKTRTIKDEKKDLDVKLKDEVEEETKVSLSKEDLLTLESALDEVSKEKYELLLEKEGLQEIKKEMKNYKEDIDEIKQFSSKEKPDLRETKAAIRLRKRVEIMVQGLDKLYSKLRYSFQQTKERKDLAEEKADDLVNIKDLYEAMKISQKVGDETKLQKVIDFLEIMDIDKDGYVKVKHVKKLIEYLEKETNEVYPSQTQHIINEMMKEEIKEKSK